MQPDREPPIPQRESDSSLELLTRARAGDQNAVSDLVRRYLPALRRWAHGRLPDYARDIADTDDLVQGTMIRALARLEHFDPKHPGAFPAYLRKILVNVVKDEIRRVKRRQSRKALDPLFPDPRPTPLERTVGRDVLDRYECAMKRLSEEHQAAITLRVELGLGYQEVGQLMGGRTANAARLMVVRAVQRLAEEMGGE